MNNLRRLRRACIDEKYRVWIDLVMLVAIVFIAILEIYMAMS